MIRRIFVYGTLRPDMRNWDTFRYASDSEWEMEYDAGWNFPHHEPAIARGWDLYHIDTGDYPAIIPGTGVVRGDVIEVEARSWHAILDRCDKLEGFDPGFVEGSLYLRTTTTVELVSGAEVVAWVYEWNTEHGEDLEIVGTRVMDEEWRPRRW